MQAPIKELAIRRVELQLRDKLRRVPASDRGDGNKHVSGVAFRSFYSRPFVAPSAISERRSTPQAWGGGGRAGRGRYVIGSPAETGARPDAPTSTSHREEEPEFPNGKDVAGTGRREITRKNSPKNDRGEVDKGRHFGGRSRKRRRESVDGIVDVGRGRRDNKKDAETERV